MALLRTCEKDVHSSAAVADFLCFDIDRDASVYVLYMPRSEPDPSTETYYPGWLTSTFQDKHEDTVERIDASPDNRNNYEIFSSYFPAGRVCLGGNEDSEVLPPGWKMYNNYVVVVGPVKKFPDFAVKISNVRNGRSAPKCDQLTCADGETWVNHVYDVPGQLTCGCAPLDDPCRTDQGPAGPQCVNEPKVRARAHGLISFYNRPTFFETQCVSKNVDALRVDGDISFIIVPHSLMRRLFLSPSTRSAPKATAPFRVGARRASTATRRSPRAPRPE